MNHRVLLHEPANPLPAHLLHQMFMLRHRVFKERMGWSVGFRTGEERDCYDLMSPIYALAVDEAGHVDGCWRLMPTTGPYLLKDVFGSLLYDHKVPAHPRVWEASRFAVDTARLKRHPAAVTEATALLVAALLEFGLGFGLEKIVAVSDLCFERILTRAGLKTHHYGKPQPYGVTRAVAGWFDVTQENFKRVLAATSIGQPPLWPAPDLVKAA